MESKSRHVVCEVHFEPSMVHFVGTRKELKENSVPVHFCDCIVSSKPFSTLSDHSYSGVEGPRRKPMDELEINTETNVHQLGRMRENLSGQEKLYIPARRRRTSLTHSAECSLSRLCLKQPPPPPSALPNTPPQGKVQHLIEENARLKKQVTPLMERARLVSKVISADLLITLKLGSHRGFKWTMSSIIEGLSLKFSCGKTGYEQLRKKMPLPSPRTLRRCMWEIDFQPGVLDVVFNCLQSEVTKMRLMDRNCVIVFDEMSIEPRLDLDQSNGCYIGNVTIPHGASSECACKALVFMVNGLARRYKQVVGYHFCGAKNNTDGADEVLVEILERCEMLD